MSWADVKHHYEEQDDEPPPGRTIPEKPVPHQRFMQQHTSVGGWFWDVYDWVPSACRCIGMARGSAHPEPDPLCSVCKGTGNAGPEPELVAAGLLESDARLLAFGGELLRVAKLLYKELGCVPGDVFEAMDRKTTDGLKNVLKNLGGT